MSLGSKGGCCCCCCDMSVGGFAASRSEVESSASTSLMRLGEGIPAPSPNVSVGNASGNASTNQSCVGDSVSYELSELASV